VFLAAALGATSGVSGGATSPKSSIILRGDAVGTIHFGEAQSVAAAALVKLIGRSDGGVQKVNQGDCVISAAMYWPNFAAYFYHGKFDGYQANPNGKSKGVFIGVTPQGLRVGYTLARAEKLYGSAFSTGGEQNGVYAAVTKTGTIRGFLSTEPNLAPATKVTILTISAGSVGCPAMSPG
jgi:hypothetical protein